MGTNYVSNGVTGETRAGNVTNNVTIGPDGLTLFGTARKLSKISISSSSFNEGYTPPSAAIINLIAYVWAFKKGSNENITQSFEPPNDYENGTDILIHFEWAPSDTDTGDVKWDLNYNLVDDGDSIGTAPSLITTTQTAPGVALQKTTTAVLTIPGAGITKDTFINLLAGRDGGAAGDTYNADAYLSAVLVEYTVNKLGSDL